jgi:DNA-binding NarL/FixJ family response regulator
MKNKIRIAIAEDHELVRQGMVALAKREKGLSMVFDVSNGQELLDGLKTKKVDVILLDLNMPILNGHQALKIIGEKYPEVKVIIVSMMYDDEYITESIELGARGFLPKNTDFDELVDAIFSVHETGHYFDKQITKSLVKSIASQKGRKPLNSSYSLSDREKEVLLEICNGKSNDAIAESLSISIRTVETHKRNLFSKTNNKNSVGLVLFAITNGLFVIRAE